VSFKPLAGRQERYEFVSRTLLRLGWACHRRPDRSGSANSDTGIKKSDGLAQLGEDFVCTRSADREKTPSHHSAAFKAKVALEAIRGE
jgi:hypothetical protein